MATSVLKFGIIGTGYSARNHARAFRQIEGAEIVAWASGHWENAVAASREFGGNAMTTEELLAYGGIEAVVIATPISCHAEQMMKAAEHGKHVFCETPIARTEAQANDMIAAAEKSKIAFYVAHTLRFVPQYAEARLVLLSGAIGSLRRAICRRLNQPPSDRGAWYYDFTESLGCILHLHIHDFDFLNWCLGKPSRVEVETMPGIDTSSLMHAIVHLYFASGARAEVEGSWMNDKNEYSLTLVGDSGKLMLHSSDAWLRIEGGQPIEVTPRDPYVAQMAHFIEHVRARTRLLVTPAEAAAALSISLAALKKFERRA